MNWIPKDKDWYLANSTIYIKYQDSFYIVIKDNEKLHIFTNLDTAKRYAENINR